MFHGITSSSCRKSVLISLSSIGKRQQLYGMVNWSLASWQRRISMIYRQLVSRTSIQLWSFPTTSVNQNWEPMTFGMAPWHLVSDTDRSKEALQSQSPIAAFKACNVIQAIGIAYSKIVLPSGDSKGESKNRTYCPTTWNNSYTWQYAADYADQLRQDRASALLCKECTLLVRVQLSRKSANHPNCAFADSASTVMCGAMISLTPCIAAKVDRQVGAERRKHGQPARRFGQTKPSGRGGCTSMLRPVAQVI